MIENTTPFLMRKEAGFFVLWGRRVTMMSWDKNVWLEKSNVDLAPFSS